MDLSRCEMCNSTITNFVNHRCFYNEYSYQVTGFENPDYIFGNNPQEIPATISHSAEGADVNSSAFMNRTTTLQSSTFPQSTDRERHWDVNSTADCTSGVENPAMAFFTEADTRLLNPVQEPCINNIELMQHDPNLSFYNQLPSNSRGLEDPSNYLTIYNPTNEYYNVAMNMQSGQSAMQDCEISHFQDKEYDAIAIARKLDRREKNTSFASDLNCTSINASIHQLV
ncbi:hypothetical protein CDAR_561741 [Caerostris darwini]|uniref:Uncharacterized protein n=1 Tax=Caerostris darwini TaxID=1538125 RepID=A0AAV4QRY1_9ARAC|nr:hypothetical protein CDAR_561731 [Caerostris darwini]GIY10923.1 hypothetical protein CDAR_561741 [Caerostris darwini]